MIPVNSFEFIAINAHKILFVLKYIDKYLIGNKNLYRESNVVNECAVSG